MKNYDGMKFNRLYWKITATLLLLLGLVGLSYVFVSGYTARHYLQEVNQRLYGEIAEHLVKETQPLVNGAPDTLATHDIMHSLMVINPSVEVYLLDTVGNIIDYVVPYSKVELERVNLDPVREFLDSEGKRYIPGDDPKNPGAHNAFSAAPIYEEDQLTGYAYIILAGEEHKEVTSTLFGSYILQMGAGMFLATLGLALLLGLLAIWLITRNLRTVVHTIKEFKNGNFGKRIPPKASRDLPVLAQTFNEMADTIVAHMDQQKSVEELRRELIANVSHDLRTPLSILQGYVETMLLKNEELNSEDRKKFLQTVLDSTNKLSRLVSQLFEFSKLEANEIEPQKEPFQMGELVQDIVHKFEILASKKGIALEFQTHPSLPLVNADIALVDRVIQNLLENAIKFTPGGGRIQVGVTSAGKWVEVKISDTGPGIPVHEQSYIFERYKQAPTNGMEGKGAGLGLAIAKKILELHNATIRVQSRLNEGTAFMFQLPSYTGTAS